MTSELSHEITLTPAFHDLDPMNVVWHGNYLRYFEQARCALLARYRYDYPAMRDSGYLWPVVDLRIKYVQPLHYGQSVLVRATITEWENRLKIEYLVRDAASGRRLTKGYTIQVAVEATSGELCFVCPPVLWERLGIKP
ncbi:4-hydroxybenzoyl-CoA thioesterase [Cupriavidus sp. USMAA2-4]|uniref:4-hydroxybenzoyl-CoA thioesterase n=1 Tax=Cupriavidus malaysiensis TaxID=367825 RepID=A0ABM6FDI0_9BURK|nr:MULTISPECIES: thioesterase family protein [Cupriavidus]AOY96782.1 4-hydroxybenzoyl-CoA thioesterase [Cupriavidus sp. USMAA2-4]AOZ02814.1 4-hydroxybenzoyl-CoA thioesterase [Cupriavidus sp. USMAHM13]AOZ09814.1 4-hydroxybenzoyl-CoA thioesterase [Cupriavidus malaysiensis]